MNNDGKATADSIGDIEARWRQRWQDQGIYRFDRSKVRSEVFAIDTPPPTVSGSLHPGHCFSYAHTDFIARYQRMRGKEVFYPMGWDDNGLNTERRVQLLLGVTCDPRMPFDPDFQVPDTKIEPARALSRPNFIACCQRVTEILEQQYFDLWSRLGLSVDWTQTYTTVGRHATHTSQAAFVELLHKGAIYRAEAPTMWEVDFQSSIAQAEQEDREIPGAYHRLRFRTETDDGHPIHIETTRPELLPACVALVAHPDDTRYQHLFGRRALTPLFDVAVPIVAHELAEIDKGSGIAMVCTFGDTADVTWWRELGLELRTILDRTGRIVPDPPQGLTSERGLSAFREMAGKKTQHARQQIVIMLTESGEMEGPPRPITHAVKHWENGTKPLEIIPSSQWFIRYPSKGDMLGLGDELHWVPPHMKVRYDDWVKGLAGDWNITRQRYFGVPFPAWYPIDDDGNIIADTPIVADAAALPVDPSTDVPPGYTEAQRHVPGGFTADPDVMDTWATSSLTPQIAGHWADDPDLFHRVFPFDLRPQAHEIIRTWLLYTAVRSHYTHGALPWSTAAISGFVFDPTRKKLSKSSDNSPDTPHNLIGDFGADAVRYWAAGGKPGMDLAFDRNQFKIGRKLVVKILSVGRFLDGFGPPPETGTISHPLDLALLAKLNTIVSLATEAMDGYDYTKALSTTETFFWSFCDDFIELVKSRAYRTDPSVLRTLHKAFDTMLLLFAPFLPFVCDEAWTRSHEHSIHRSPWPGPDHEVPDTADTAHFELAATVLAEIRKAKSSAKVSLRTPVASLKIRANAQQLQLLGAVADDLQNAGNVKDLVTQQGDELAVDVELEQSAG